MLSMGEYSVLAENVDCYCIAPISIGAHCTVSQGAFLCTGSHDISSPTMRLLCSPIKICDNAWVCARAYVGPGVTVSEGAVVAACGVAVKDIPPWTVVGGNPARQIKIRQIQEVEVIEPT